MFSHRGLRVESGRAQVQINDFPCVHRFRYRGKWSSDHPYVSCSPSKIPYGGFSPVRLQTEIPPRPSPVDLEIKRMTRIPSLPTNLYAANVHLFPSPVALRLQVLLHGLFRPEALGSPAGYAVPPGLCLLWPHEPLSVSPTGLSISPKRVFVLRSDRNGYREDPQFTPRVFLTVPSSVPRQSDGADRLFLLHPHWPSPSLQRLGICNLPAGSLWVVCDFGAATFALCYGPASCLLFTGKSFYFRAFASRGRPRRASSITIRPNSQLPEPDFHRQDTQHYGLRTEGTEFTEILAKDNAGHG